MEGALAELDFSQTLPALYWSESPCEDSGGSKSRNSKA